MAIFERISDLVKANINDLIDKAENPEKMVKQIIIDMEDQLRKATQGLGTAMGSCNQVKKQLATAQEQSNMWQAKAKTCLEQGNEDLARQALENKVKQDKMVAQYQEMVNSMEGQVNEIKTQVDVLKQKLEEARSKQAMLVARSRMADAKSQMAKTLGGMDSKSAFAKMDKMEEKISQKESQADAFSEVSGIQESESDPFAQMDKENSIKPITNFYFDFIKPTYKEFNHRRPLLYFVGSYWENREKKIDHFIHTLSNMEVELAIYIQYLNKSEIKNPKITYIKDRISFMENLKNVENADILIDFSRNTSCLLQKRAVTQRNINKTRSRHFHFGIFAS